MTDTKPWFNEPSRLICTHTPTPTHTHTHVQHASKIEEPAAAANHLVTFFCQLLFYKHHFCHTNNRWGTLPFSHITAVTDIVKNAIPLISPLFLSFSSNTPSSASPSFSSPSSSSSSSSFFHVSLLHMGRQIEGTWTIDASRRERRGVQRLNQGRR